jgi:hypothetical protein
MVVPQRLHPVDEVFKKYPENYTCCKNNYNIQFLKFDDCHDVIKPACRIGKVNTPDDQRMNFKKYFRYLFKQPCPAFVVCFLACTIFNFIVNSYQQADIRKGIVI